MLREDGAGRWAERLEGLRGECFVGRVDERRLLRRVLRGEAKARLLYVRGPGGVGKSELLRAFMRDAVQDGRSITFLPGDRVGSDITSARQLLGSCGPESGPDPLIAIDGYESLGALDPWLRESFLPSLPSGAVVVLAGRCRLGPAWLGDAAWTSLLRVIALRNFTEGEASEYLARKGVPERMHGALRALTHGHPLALTLCASATRRWEPASPSLAWPPDQASMLRGRLMGRVPGPLHRHALEVCALARITSETLLATVVDSARASALFEWLFEHPATESRAEGLVLQPLARDVVVADLRWRARDRFEHWLERLGEHFVESGEDFFHVAQHVHGWKAFPPIGEGGFVVRGATPAEIERVAEWIEAGEGARARRLFDYWSERDAETLVVVGQDETIAAYALRARLDRVDGKTLQRDPAFDRLAPFLRREEAAGALRPDHRIVCYRFWGGRRSPLAHSPATSFLFAHLHTEAAANQWPRLVLQVVDSRRWKSQDASEPYFAESGTEFELGRRRLRVVVQDFRARSYRNWILDCFRGALAKRRAHPEPLRMDATGFARAVRGALRHSDRPDLLQTNPLTQSRLVSERCGSDAPARRVETMLELLREQLSMFEQSERDKVYYRLLLGTYFPPGVKQRAIADRLGLSWGTYRRHHTVAMRRYIDALWQREQPRLPT